MRCIEAVTQWVPESNIDQEPSLFLAGGITGCPDWQSEIIYTLRLERVMLLNPRRKNFPINDATASRQQIEWEHQMLRQATGILFWFPCETLCPIALYELGAWSMQEKPLFVGVHPDYRRRDDVVIQTELTRPDVKVVFSLTELVHGVRRWLNWRELSA